MLLQYQTESRVVSVSFHVNHISDLEQISSRTNFTNEKHLGWRTVSRVMNAQAGNNVGRQARSISRRSSVAVQLSLHTHPCSNSSCFLLISLCRFFCFVFCLLLLCASQWGQRRIMIFYSVLYFVSINSFLHIYTLSTCFNTIASLSVFAFIKHSKWLPYSFHLLFTSYRLFILFLILTFTLPTTFQHNISDMYFSTRSAVKCRGCVFGIYLANWRVQHFTCKLDNRHSCGPQLLQNIGHQCQYLTLTLLIIL